MGAGIIFPDFARSFGAGQALRQQEEQNAFQMERARRQDQIEAEDREAGSHFGAALKGDPTAIAKVSANPKFALPLAQYMQKMSDGERAKLKEQFEVTGKTAAGILALPDAEQPAAYEAAYQNLTAQGYKINLPPRWSPDLKGKLQSYAIQVPEYLKVIGDRPTPMGGAPGAPAAAPPNRDAFVQTMMPHALEVSKATGLDPRLVIAQAALETGYGQSAPGNNYFGIKSHGRAGGQVLPTQEAGPNGMYGTRESFRTYGSPSESARDYAEFLKTNGRYAPVLQAQGLDAQIEAMGRSGYATDPNYGAKLRQIAQGLPDPGLAQGDTQPRADASGNPLPPAGADPEVFGIKSWLAKAMPGATPMGVRGKPVYDSQGKLMITKPDGSVDFVDVPKPQQPPAGYRPAGGGLEPIPGGPADKRAGGPFAGTGMDAQSMNILLTGDPASPEYALAYSHLSKPRTTIDDQGRPVTIQPMDLSAVRKPAAVAGAPAAPAGGTTTALPGGGTVTVGDSVAPKGPSAPEMAKLRNARAEAEKITAAANDFKAEWAKASPVDRARALAGANTPLNAAYNNFALLAKGDALFQLGVLNGPDLEIIRRTIPDPSTGKSIMTTETDVTSSVDKVLNILNTGISATEKQLGIAPPAAQQSTPEAGGGQRLTPEEAQKLPPGTTFIGTDGVQRVRR